MVGGAGWRRTDERVALSLQDGTAAAEESHQFTQIGTDGMQTGWWAVDASVFAACSFRKTWPRVQFPTPPLPVPQSIYSYSVTGTRDAGKFPASSSSP